MCSEFTVDFDCSTRSPHIRVRWTGLDFPRICSTIPHDFSRVDRWPTVKRRSHAIEDEMKYIHTLEKTRETIPTGSLSTDGQVLHVTSTSCFGFVFVYTTMYVRLRHMQGSRCLQHGVNRSWKRLEWCGYVRVQPERVSQALVHVRERIDNYTVLLCCWLSLPVVWGYWLNHLNIRKNQEFQVNPQSLPWHTPCLIPCGLIMRYGRVRPVYPVSHQYPSFLRPPVSLPALVSVSCRRFHPTTTPQVEYRPRENLPSLIQTHRSSWLPSIRLSGPRPVVSLPRASRWIERPPRRDFLHITHKENDLCGYLSYLAGDGSYTSSLSHPPNPMQIAANTYPSQTL